MCTATPFTLICPIIVFCTLLLPPSTSLIPQPAGNLTIRWPTDLTIEVVASSSISNLNSIVHLLHDDITRASWRDSLRQNTNYRRRHRTNQSDTEEPVIILITKLTCTATKPDFNQQ